MQRSRTEFSSSQRASSGGVEGAAGEQRDAGKEGRAGPEGP